MEDPRVMVKYIKILVPSFHDHGLFNQMNKVHTSATHPLPHYLCLEYEKIDYITCILMDKTESKCRKLRTGAITWSPAYTNICLLLLYWQLRKTNIEDHNSNVRQVSSLQNKLKFTYYPTMTKDQIIHELKLAHKQRIKTKNMAESLSLEYMTRLAMGKEEASDMKSAVYLRNINRIEGQRRGVRNIKIMEGKAKGGKHHTD